MIRIEEGGWRFNYRVVGVAVRGDSVLLQRGEGEGFWTCPGGRAEIGETAGETLRREMREELNVEVEVGRPLWLVENFFTLSGRRHHELDLYFLMRLPDGCAYTQGQGPFPAAEANDARLVFRWFPRRAELLSTLPLLPAFLRTELSELPESLRHVVHGREPASP